MRTKNNRVPILTAILGLLLSTAAQAAFTPISQPTASYTGTTTLFPITAPDFSVITSLTVGPQTINFAGAMRVATVPPTWSTWGCPPNTETCTPRVLVTDSLSVTFTLPSPAGAFGLEVEPEPFGAFPVTATFYNGATVLGTVTQGVNGEAGALLAAATDNPPFTSVTISCTCGGAGFAVANVRAGFWLQLNANQYTATASGLGYNGVTNSYTAQVTIENTSGGTIPGPFFLVISALTGHLALANANGTFGGSPYVLMPGLSSLPPWGMDVVTLVFTYPPAAAATGRRSAIGHNAIGSDGIIGGGGTVSLPPNNNLVFYTPLLYTGSPTPVTPD